MPRCFRRNCYGNIKERDKVSLVGFGTFEAKTRAAREGLTREQKKNQNTRNQTPGFKAAKL
jgi:nucleoid DNA-binding protein